VFAAVEPEGGVETVMARLNDKLQKYNLQNAAPYRLSVSVGLAFVHPHETQTVEELMALADESMYHNKRQRKASLAWREMEVQSFSEAVA
jgi:GGDEF domain-containing protein